MLNLHIVEDVEIVRDTLVHHIDWEKLGLEVTGVAKDGEQALAQMERHVPDLLVTDIGMPMMDGIELIKRVKVSFPETKCIILSNHSEFKYAQEAIKLGVIEYVLKPIDIDELTEVVGRTVSQIREERRRQHELLKAKEIFKDQLPYMSGEEESMSGLSGNMKNNKIADRIMAYIKANITSKTLALQPISAQVNLSEKYVNSLFKETVGTTINNYIISQKMKLAAQLLKDPDVKIYEVCDHIGYSDQGYFRESFKKHHGLTPSEYRTRYL